VECGSGTYIRSLAVVLGEALGCGAHLTALRRCWVEPFRSPTMWTLEQIAAAAEQGDEALLPMLLPVAEGLADLPAIVLDAAQGQAISQGRKIRLEPPPAPPGRCATFGEDGALLALAELDDQGLLRVLRGFNLPPPAPVPDASPGGSGDRFVKAR